MLLLYNNFALTVRSLCFNRVCFVEAPFLSMLQHLLLLGHASLLLTDASILYTHCLT